MMVEMWRFRSGENNHGHFYVNRNFTCQPNVLPENFVKHLSLVPLFRFHIISCYLESLLAPPPNCFFDGRHVNNGQKLSHVERDFIGSLRLVPLDDSTRSNGWNVDGRIVCFHHHQMVPMVVQLKCCRKNAIYFFMKATWGWVPKVTLIFHEFETWSYHGIA